MKNHETIKSNEDKKSSSKFKRRAAGAFLAGAALTGVGCAPGVAKADKVKSSDVTAVAVTPKTKPNPATNNTKSSSQEHETSTSIIKIDGKPQPAEYMYTDTSGNINYESYIKGYFKLERDFRLTGNTKYLLALLGSNDVPLYNNELEDRQTFLDATGYTEGQDIPPKIYTVVVNKKTTMYNDDGSVETDATYNTEMPDGSINRTTEHISLTPPTLVPSEANPGAFKIFVSNVSASREITTSK